MRTVSVEIFDERALTDDQRIAYAKIAVPQSVFEVNLTRSPFDCALVHLFTLMLLNITIRSRGSGSEPFVALVRDVMCSGI